MKRWKFNQFVLSILINLFYRSDLMRTNVQNSRENHFIIIWIDLIEHWTLNVKHKWIICLIDGIWSIDNVSFFIHLIILIWLFCCASYFCVLWKFGFNFWDTFDMEMMCELDGMNRKWWLGVERVCLFLLLLFFSFSFRRKKNVDWLLLDEVVNGKENRSFSYNFSSLCKWRSINTTFDILCHLLFWTNYLMIPFTLLQIYWRISFS